MHVLVDKDLPDTPAAKRGLELIRVINLNKEEELNSYVQANFASSIPVAEQAQDFLSDSHRSNGFIVNKVEKLVGLDEVNFIVLNRLTKMKERFHIKVKKILHIR